MEFHYQCGFIITWIPISWLHWIYTVLKGRFRFLVTVHFCISYSQTCLKRPLKKKTIFFLIPIIAKCRPKVLQNAPREHSAILLTFIKLPFVSKIFVLSISEWLLKTVCAQCDLGCTYKVKTVRKALIANSSFSQLKKRKVFTFHNM